MRWNFRTKLTTLIFGLIITALGGSTVFFYRLYKNDKLASILQGDLANTSQAAHHLDNLLLLASVIETSKVLASKEIPFLIEDPCMRGPSFRLTVSRHYVKQFEDLELEPRQWLESLDLYKVCKAVSITDQAQFQETSYTVIPSRAPMMNPYVLVLIRNPTNTRLAMLSMDGFHTTTANTLFVLNSAGEMLWSADGPDYYEGAIRDTGVTKAELKGFAEYALNVNVPHVQEAGKEGLASYARVGHDWVMVSLSYGPTALEPVYYALRQSMLLVLGFFFLCLFIGKNGASFITRPLNELRNYAEKVGQGNLHARLNIQGKGTDEISTVKTAFNVMTQKILKLLEDTKIKATMESELELAQQVQKLLMPSSSVQSGGHRIHSHVQSATQCSGDWWGYMEVPRENDSPLFVVMVGDVTGHGASSALITATVRGALSVLTAWIEANPGIAQDPRQIVRHFNRAVFDAAKGAITMTFFLAVMDSSARKFSCVNAGHNFPYLLHQDPQTRTAQVTSIGRGGIPLGHSPDTDFDEMDTYDWIKGSQLFLYTDGLTENIQDDKNLFDRKSLLKTLRVNATTQGKDLLLKVLKEREKQIQGLPAADDVTVVVCEAVI